MKYNRFEIGPYNLHIIKTDKFKRNVISVSFKRRVKKEEVTIRNLLSGILVKSTSKYKNEKEMCIESEELYDLGYSSSNSISGNYSIMTIEITFLNDKYTEAGNTKKCIEFLSEIIFNPNVVDNKFNKQAFELIKEELRVNLENMDEQPKKIASKLIHEAIDKDAPYAFLADGYLEDLEKIDEKELFEYYQKVLKSDLIDIFVIGELEDNIKDLIVKSFKFNTIKKPATSHYVNHKKYRNRVQNIKVKKDLNQSILKIGFKIDNLSEFERKYVTYVYNYILSGGPDSKLFKNVREKNSLCYNINSGISIVFNLMMITAGISAKDYKKCITLIKKELKNMEKGNFNEEEMNAAKAVYTSSLLAMQDSPYNTIGFYRSKEYLNLDPIETRIEEIKKVNKEMIMKVAKKMKMDTTLLLEGENNEED